MSSLPLLPGPYVDYCSGYDPDLYTWTPEYADQESFDLVNHANVGAGPMVIQESPCYYLHMGQDTGLPDRSPLELFPALDDYETGSQQCWLDFFQSLEGQKPASAAGGYSAEAREGAQQLSSQRLGPGGAGEDVTETPREISKVPAQRQTDVAIPTSDDDDHTPSHGSPDSAFVAHGSSPQQKAVFVDLTLSDTEESDDEDDLPTLHQLFQRHSKRA